MEESPASGLNTKSDDQDDLILGESRLLKGFGITFIANACGSCGVFLFVCN